MTPFLFFTVAQFCLLGIMWQYRYATILKKNQYVRRPYLVHARVGILLMLLQFCLSTTIWHQRNLSTNFVPLKMLALINAGLNVGFAICFLDKIIVVLDGLYASFTMTFWVVAAGLNATLQLAVCLAIICQDYELNGSKNGLDTFTPSTLNIIHWWLYGSIILPLLSSWLFVWNFPEHPAVHEKYRTILTAQPRPYWLLKLTVVWSFPGIVLFFLRKDIAQVDLFWSVFGLTGPIMCDIFLYHLSQDVCRVRWELTGDQHKRAPYNLHILLPRPAEMIIPEMKDYY